MLTVEGAALEHALDQFAMLSLAAAHGRVEGHNAMRAQPQHQVGRLVAGEVVSTSNSRSGGRSCGNVKGLVRPACHTAQAAGVAAGVLRDGAGAGGSARIALRRSRGQRVQDRIGAASG